VPAVTPAGRQVFLVEPGDPGVSVTRQRTVDSDSAGLVRLAGVALPADRVLGGTEETAAAMWRTGWSPGPPWGCADPARGHRASAGAHRRVMPAAGSSSVARSAGSGGGRSAPDAYVDVEAIRLTLWQAAWLVSTGQAADAEVATAKFWGGDAGHRVAHTRCTCTAGGYRRRTIPCTVTSWRPSAASSPGRRTEQLLRLGGTLAAEQPS